MERGAEEKTPTLFVHRERILSYILLVIREKHTWNPFLQFSGSAIVYRKTYINVTLLRDYDYDLSLLLFCTEVLLIPG